MPYDLYGNYYQSVRDAENAELAQMAEINSRHTQMEMQNQFAHRESEIHTIWQYVNMLEDRIKQLEETKSQSNGTN